MGVKVKPITLNTYIDSYDISKAPSLFVVNRTNPLGDIAFNCINDMGQQTAVIIPATTIPIDLTTQVPADLLIRSSYFKRVLEKSRARIITTESAEAYIADSPRYQEEYNRVNKIDQDARAGVGDLENDEEIDLDMGSRGKRSIKHENEDVSSNMFVNAFIERCNGDDYDDHALEAEFLNKGLNLPVKELRTLLKYVNRQIIRDLIVEAINDAEEPV
ncbi:hypothetical protein YOLOSWAG_220 [Erwinia phage vB_EamM_Yoloswag]|uniref:Uncharacterized protein n=1 Tax=Erwinia phage vB_EamM_Yoloswag TaxID=1958956 RepID=A0A1S6L3E4_9CAUD|nr:hypothetical protein HOR66_gp220 [Erwinia phage vB_EamM_Yoloswag]AQT28698.1 hypothetical protein YOLOSWAG_220 [Erwinia phage vB_EamM_Yoloswag]